MSRPRRSPSEAEQARLATIRGVATAKVTEALSGAPDASDDLLGRIAWYTAIVGVEDDRVVWLVETAINRRLTWREIATAVGISPDDAGEIDNLARNHRRRRNR